MCVTLVELEVDTYVDMFVRVRCVIVCKTGNQDVRGVRGERRGSGYTRP